MGGLLRKRRNPAGAEVEFNPVALKVVDARRCVRREQADGGIRGQVAGSGESVVGMFGGAVSASDRSCYPTLGIRRAAALERSVGDDADPRARRRRECCHQTGDAAADDNEIEILAGVHRAGTGRATWLAASTWMMRGSKLRRSSSSMWA